MGEFQSWLDKAECVAALPVEPDHREQLNTALEKVQVEPFSNSKASFGKYTETNRKPGQFVWKCVKIRGFHCAFAVFPTPLGSSNRITKPNEKNTQNENKSFIPVC